MRKEATKKLLWPAASFLCCFFAATLFMGLTAMLTDGYFYLGDDSAQQQITFMNAMAEALRSGNTVYAHACELGSGFLDAYGYYGVGSPFFLSAVALGVRDFAAVMIPYTAFRIALAGVTSWFLMKRYVKTDFGALLGSLLYALSTYQIVNLYFHFADSLVFFPLLLLGLDLAMEGKRILLFPAVVALAACTNPVFFFSEAVFLILYFAVRLWNKDWRLTVKKFLFLAVLTAVGLCLSAALLLPVAVSVMGNPRAAEGFSSLEKLLLLKPVQFAEIFRSLILPAEAMFARALYIPINSTQADLYIPLFGCVLWGSYVLKNRKGFIAKLLTVSLIIALVPVLNSAFMMFNAEYYARWLFMPAFFMAAATVNAFEDRQLSLKGGFLLTGIFTLVFIGNIVWWHIRYGVDSVVGPTKFCFLVAAAAGGLVFCLLLRRIQRLGVGNLLITAAVLAFTVITGFVNTYLNKTAYIRGGFSAEAYFEDQPELPDAGEYRIDTVNSYINKGILLDISSLNSFTSTVPASVFDFYRALGFSRTVRSNQSNRYPFIRSLLSCRYVIVSPGSPPGYDAVPENLVSDGANYKVYANPDYIPMGFGFNYCIGESEFLSVSEQDRGGALLTALVLPDEAVADCGLRLLTAEELSRISQDASGEISYHKTAACREFCRTRDGYRAEAGLTENDLLFFSIPYSDGFTIYVNGEETDAVRADFGFYAVPCPAGENVVEFKFRQPGLTAGWALTAVGVLGFSALALIARKKCRGADSPFTHVLHVPAGWPNVRGTNIRQNSREYVNPTERRTDCVR